MAEVFTRQIYINLAVRDLKKTMEFFSKLGFSFNPKFSDENAACMIINDQDSFHVLTNAFYFWGQGSIQLAGHFYQTLAWPEIGTCSRITMPCASTLLISISPLMRCKSITYANVRVFPTRIIASFCELFRGRESARAG